MGAPTLTAGQNCPQAEVFSFRAVQEATCQDRVGPRGVRRIGLGLGLAGPLERREEGREGVAFDVPHGQGSAHASDRVNC